MSAEQMPSLPRHPEHRMQWTALEMAEIEAYGRSVATVCAYIAREAGGVDGVIAAQEIERRFSLLEKS